MSDNYSVDLDQVIVNLLGITKEKELMARHGLTRQELNNLTRYFKIAVGLIDEHLERLPKLHTTELLLLEDKRC